ncbi:MAG TPA: tripartite tricarboxylate transporter substrate binding protein [Aquabacterium sp.]|nr:tripartite tricarboxylate transporter substrate binding protein [Aquabacterium sp.]HQC96654.1 tripartite tricarboxylate transporter substrate binding protein [Aquabacterium sp.]
MTTRRRTLLLALAGACPGLGSLAPARAATDPGTATWPGRPLRLLAGGAGSVPDLRARWLAERLGPALGQTVVVENLPAAGGSVAAQQVARAAPDGHTLLMLTQGQATINPHLYPKLGYDPLKDLRPITRFGIGPLLVLVPNSSPWQSLGDLAGAVRARPGEVQFGSPGVGTPPHLSAELLLQALGATGQHIPYNGNGPLLAALLAGGQVQWGLEGLVAAVPHVRAGRLRALAVTSAQRNAALPEVPTVAEAGAPGFDYLGWTGLAAPAGTPEAIVQRLATDVRRIADSDEARRWFTGLGGEPGWLTPEAFAEAIRSEHGKWGALIRARGIQVP